MLRPRRTALLVALSVFTACSESSESTSSDAATTSGTGGAAMVTTSSSGAGGSMVSTGSSSSGGTGGEGAGGGVPCGYVDLVVDGAAPLHLSSSCAGTWGGNHTDKANGYYFEGSPETMTPILTMEGCVGAVDASQGVLFEVWGADGVGAYTKGAPRYIDENGDPWSVTMKNAFSVEITSYGPVGGSIDGTFEFPISQGAAETHQISGSFHVCRVADQPL